VLCVTTSGSTSQFEFRHEDDGFNFDELRAEYDAKELLWRPPGS
jgi:hypothetical protein